MAQNEEPNTKGDGGAKDDSYSCEPTETVGNEVMPSGCGEILIAETRKSNKDEQPKNREPELEERAPMAEKAIRERKKKEDENWKKRKSGKQKIKG